MAQKRQGNGTTTMTGSAVTLFTAFTQGKEFLFFALAPAGQNITALSIEARVKGNSSTWRTLANAASDFTSPSGSIFGASGDLTALAAAATGWAKVQVTGDYEIRVRATAVSAGTVAWEFNTARPER